MNRGQIVKKTVEEGLDIGRKLLKKTGLFADELVDSMPEEQVKKLTKSIATESKDAPNNLIGKGKNLDTLEAARKNIPETHAAPSYPKNITQDDLATKKPTDFITVDDNKLPVVRENTLPHVQKEQVLNKAPKYDIMGKSASKVDDAIEVPYTVGQAKPKPLADVAESMQGQLDDALNPGMSARKKALLATGVTAAGLGGMAMMGGADENQQKSKAFDPITASALISAVPATINALSGNKDEGRAPSDEKTSADNQPIVKDDAGAPEESDYVKQLQAAQDHRDKLDFIDNMLRAGTTVGNALATPTKQADYSVVDALQAQNTKGINDLKQKMATETEAGNMKDVQELRDPNSEMSKTLRSMLSQLGYPVGDNVSGKQLKDMGINVYNLLAQKESREQARQNREMMMGDRNRQQAYGATDRAVSNLYNSKDYKSYTNAKDALNSLDHAISTGDKTAIGTAFMGYAKFAQNDDSVVRSEDMKTLAGHYNYSSPQEMISKLSAKAHGGDFSKQELEAMKAVINHGIHTKGQRVAQMLAPIQGKIKGSGLNVEEHIDPGILDEFSQYAGGAKASGKTDVGGSQYTPQQEQAIALVMQNNKGATREQAIAALKKQKKIP